MHLHRETDPKDRSPFQEQMKHTQAEIYCDCAISVSVTKLRNISRPYSYSRDDSATKCDLFHFGSFSTNCFFYDRTLQRNRVQMTLTVCVNACPGNYKHALVISVGLRFNRPTRGINFLPSITSTSGSEQLLRESLQFGAILWQSVRTIYFCISTSTMLCSLESLYKVIQFSLDCSLQNCEEFKLAACGKLIQ